MMIKTTPLRFHPSWTLKPPVATTTHSKRSPMAFGSVRTEANPLDLYLRDLGNIQQFDATTMAQKAEIVQAGRLAAEILEPDSPEKRKRLNKDITEGQKAAEALQHLLIETDRERFYKLTKAVHQGKFAQTVLDKTNAPLTDEAVAIYNSQREAGLKARNEMVKANTPLVVHIAKGFKQRAHMQELGLDEVIAMGNEGLIRAADKFNPQMIQASFASHATWWIKERIIRGLRASSLVHVPESANKDQGDDDETDWSQCTSLNVPLNAESDTEWIDTVPDRRPNPEELCALAQDKQLVHDAIAALKGRQPDIIRIFHELVGRETNPTFENLGKMFGVTHQAVQQQEKRARRTLEQNPVLQALWEELKTDKA